MRESRSLVEFLLTIVSKDASLASKLVELVFSTEFEGFIFRGSSFRRKKLPKIAQLLQFSTSGQNFGAEMSNFDKFTRRAVKY